MNVVKKEKNETIYSKCKKLGYNETISTIVANRINEPEDVEQIIEISEKNFIDYKFLKDCDEASDFIIENMLAKKHFCFSCDVDTDGNTGLAILRRVFSMYDGVFSFTIGEREWGNGLNSKVVNNILNLHNDNPINILLTSDFGSSDKDSVKILQDNGIDCIITDHHIIPHDNYDLLGKYFINPQRKDCSYDKRISGCNVTFVLCLAIIDKMKKLHNKLPNKKLLDECYILNAVSTIGDCMKLNSPINRYFVNKGIRIANTLNTTLGQTLYLLNNKSFLCRQKIAFELSPAINSGSRMNNTGITVNALEPNDFDGTLNNLKILFKNNAERKNKQAKLIDAVKIDAITSDVNNKYSIVSKIPNGVGINGILASMVGNDHYKPTVVFVESNKKLKGSGRSINEEFDIRKSYEDINDKYPDIFDGPYGGHKGAAGCVIKLDKYEKFKSVFEEYVKNELEHKETMNTLYYDLEINADNIDIDLVDDIRFLEPYGIGFDEPIIKSKLLIQRIRFIGKGNVHSIVDLKINNEYIRAFYFNTTLTEADVGKEKTIYYNLQFNPNKFNKNLNINIIYVEDTE